MAQSPLDSLRQALVESNTNDAKAAIYLRYFDHYLFRNIDSAQYYQARSLELIDTTGCDTLVMRWLYSEATLYNHSDRVSTALAIGKKGLLCARNQDEIKWRGKFCHVIGNSHYYLSQYDDAYDQFYLALGFFTQSNFEKGRAIILSSLAVIKSKLKNYNAAISFGKEAYHSLLKTGDTLSGVTTLQNIGSFFTEINQPDSAVIYEKNALSFAQRLKLGEAYKAYSYWYIAEAFIIEERVDSIQKYANLSLNIAREANDAYLEGFCLIALGESELIDDNVSQALKYLTQAQDIAQSLDGKQLHIRLLEALTMAHEKAGNYSLAFPLFKRLVALKDETLDDAMIQEMNEMERSHQAKIEAIIAEQEAMRQQAMISRQTQISILGVIIAIVLLVVLANHFYRRQLSQKVIDFILLVTTLLFIRFIHLIYDPYTLASVSGSPYLKIVISVVIAIIMGRVHNAMQSIFRQWALQKKKDGSPADVND